MKKIISFVLVCVLVLGLCACGGSKQETAGGEGAQTATSGLQIGYSKVKIMPETSVPLGGYGNTSFRMSDNFLDFLYSTCIAATEGDETVLFFTVDLLLPNDSWVKEVRTRIESQFDIPADHINISFTHTHSGPDIYSTEESMKAYRTKWVEWTIQAASEALADRAPAVLYGTKTQTENLNFIRHYALKDGSYGGDGFGDWGKGIVDHQEPIDNEMLLVKAEREGDKPDVLIMNWAAHPCTTGGSAATDVSADFIAAVRDYVEADTGMQFAYFTGAAGNVNTTSRIPSEDKNLDKKGQGRALADVAIAALPNMTKLEGSGIEVSQVKFEYANNHEDEDKLADAKKVMELLAQGTEVAREYAVAHGMTSQHHARAITQRVSRPAVGSYELNAVRIGGLAFVTAPYEMFSSSGRYIKDNSPIDMTMVFSCSNMYGAYFPTQAAFEYGCYESWTAYYAPGCAEATAAKFVEMLQGVAQ